MVHLRAGTLSSHPIAYRDGFREPRADQATTRRYRRPKASSQDLRLPEKRLARMAQTTLERIVKEIKTLEPEELLQLQQTVQTRLASAAYSPEEESERLTATARFQVAALRLNRLA
jgi:hypothetical protein